MTKQEELREGIGRLVGGLFGEDWDTLPDVKSRNHYLYTDKLQYLKTADDFLNYLHSQGVVIKVEDGGTLSTSSEIVAVEPLI